LIERCIDASSPGRVPNEVRCPFFRAKRIHRPLVVLVTVVHLSAIADWSLIRGAGPNERWLIRGNQKTCFGRMHVKEVVGNHVLLTRSLFACGIPRDFLPLVSLAKLTSAPVRF
jgi:hypothetical protein